MDKFNILTPELLKGKNILIIGCPASGKSHITELLSFLEIPVFHTDDYKDHGFKDSLYVLINDLVKQGRPVIVEGVMGYRLLRKPDSWTPDIIIHVMISEETMIERYERERPGRDIRAVRRLADFDYRLLHEYMGVMKYNDIIPQIITIDNEYEK